MSPIVLEFFGTPQIQRDSVPVHLPRRKATALLAYLAITGQPFNRDALAGLLWPELGQQRARANLRQTLFTLNKALGPDRLEYDASDVLLPPQPDLDVDVVRFRNLLAEVAAHNHPFPHLCNSCIQKLTAAADLYRSDFMAGFALPDAPEFDTWQLLQREALQRELSTVLDRLALVFAQAGRRQFDLAIAYARRRLALDPLHEPAHRMLMRLYAESGDRVAAAHQYEACEQVLMEELGVGPDAETTALIEQIRQGEIAVKVSKDGGAPSQADAASDSLPSHATSFIGRTHELAQIATRLANPDCRLLTIVGPGGSGKTRLAVQAANAQAVNFRDGVHFVDLAPVGSADLLATTALRSLDVPEIGVTDASRRLCDYLRSRQMLLVLDNLEHLLGGVALLSEIIHTAPEIKLLATSRERLNLREEWLEPLVGLSVPPGPVQGLPPETPQSRPDLERFDGSLLFLNRMHKLRPNYAADVDALSDADATAIADLCRLLGGMPLAIELAAGWTRTLSLTELQQEVQRSMDLLRTSMQDVPPRLRSMRAAFDHSWQLLSPSHRRIMRGMSVFRGGCTRDAAEKITEATLDDLASLVDKSWLRLDEDGRYAMHELARQYCEEKLEAADADGEAGETSLQEVHLRHSTYYGRYIGDVIKGTNYRPATLDNILIEFGNLRTALDSAVAYHHLEAADSICWSIFFVGDMMGWLHYSIETLQTVVPALEERLAETHQTFQDRTEIAHVLGVILQTQFSQYSQLCLNEKAQACTRRLESLVEIMHSGRTRSFWGAIAALQRMEYGANTGNYEATIQYSRELVTLLESDEYECLVYGTERGEAFWKAIAYNVRGYAVWALGDYAAAEKLYMRSIELREETGEQRQRGPILGMYAHFLLVVGEQERADDAAREGLRLSKLYADRLGIAKGHLAVGRQLVAQNRLDAARTHLHQSLDTARYSGRLDIVIRSLTLLGRIGLAEGNPADARRCFDEALAAFMQSDSDHHNALAELWLAMGWCALTEADLAQARRMFIKASHQRGVMAYEVQEAKQGLADVLLAEGKVVDATALLQQVVDHPATAYATRQSARQQLAEAVA